MTIRFTRVRAISLVMVTAAVSSALTAAAVLPKVPSLNGEGVLRAESILRDAHLSLRVASAEEVTWQDHVVGQRPPAEMPVLPGTVVPHPAPSALPSAQ